MKIEELLAEKKIIEEQIESLKKEYDRIYSEVYLHGWREITPEEKIKEDVYNKKQTELIELTVSQIKRVTASGNIDLIKDYYYSLSKEQNYLKLLIIPYANFRDGEIMGVLDETMNAEFLNGTSEDSYVSGDDFDNSAALLGADGIKLQYLNYMLKKKETSEVLVESIDLSKLDDHILKLIAGFSTPEIAMELFGCIFKFEGSNPSLKTELFTKFASLVEHYQEQRKKYDVEVIESDKRVFNFEKSYEINFAPFYMLESLPEESRNHIIELSKANVERVKQRKRLETMTAQEMINYMMSKFGLDVHYTPPAPVVEETKDIPTQNEVPEVASINTDAEASVDSKQKTIAEMIDEVSAQSKEPEPALEPITLAEEPSPINNELGAVQQPIEPIRTVDHQQLIEQRKAQIAIEEKNIEMAHDAYINGKIDLQEYFRLTGEEISFQQISVLEGAKLARERYIERKRLESEAIIVAPEVVDTTSANPEFVATQQPSEEIMNDDYQQLIEQRKAQIALAEKNIEMAHDAYVSGRIDLQEYARLTGGEISQQQISVLEEAKLARERYNEKKRLTLESQNVDTQDAKPITDVGQTETREQDDINYQNAILEIMNNPDNSQKSVNELAELIRNNPEVAKHRAMYQSTSEDSIMQEKPHEK